MAPLITTPAFITGVRLMLDNVVKNLFEDVVSDVVRFFLPSENLVFLSKDGSTDIIG